MRHLAIVLSALTVWGMHTEPARARQLTAEGRFTRTVLHAHNCYPEHGRFRDRLARALRTAHRPIAIEQDLVWAPLGAAGGRVLVSHGEPLTGSEPTLEEHFFARVAPLLDGALAANRRDGWPVLILHLDFKTNEPAHHRAVWDLLGKYERWLTTAERHVDPGVVAPLAAGPLLVLNENGDGQRHMFHDRLSPGDRLRMFGTMPSRLAGLADLPREAQLARLAEASPEELIPSSATNYQRWTNHPWAVIEHGGQTAAGAWTPSEDERLRAVVARARTMNLWLRFYALNGHPPQDGDGRSASYNFGSLVAVQRRWDAAIAAGADFVATDQYELFAERRRARRQQEHDNE